MNHATAASPLSSAVQWRVVGLLMVFAALGHFNRIGISVAGTDVFIRKLGMNETQMGWIYTSFLMAYTVGMLPCGLLIDRIGSAWALTLFGLTMGIFIMLTGMLGWITNRPESLWPGLLVIRACAGLCNAPLHPGTAHLVSQAMPVDFRATVNGLVTTGAVIGIAFCYPLFGWLIDRLNWPLAFVVSGLVFMAYSMIWQTMTSESLAGSRENSSAETHGSRSDSGWKVMRQTNLWLLSLSYAAYGYFQYLFFYWMTYYFTFVLKVSDVEARWTSFWITLAQGAGMTIGGMFNDFLCHRLGRAPSKRAIVVMGMGLGALFALLAVNATVQINIAMCLAISMAALGMCEGVFWTTATEIGGSSRGFSAAFMNTGGNIGGMISPVLTPMMAKTMGWPGAITVACGIVVLGGAVWFVIGLPERERILDAQQATP